MSLSFRVSFHFISSKFTNFQQFSSADWSVFFVRRSVAKGFFSSRPIWPTDKLTPRGWAKQQIWICPLLAHSIQFRRRWFLLFHLGYSRQRRDAPISLNLLLSFLADKMEQIKIKQKWLSWVMSCSTFFLCFSDRHQINLTHISIWAGHHTLFWTNKPNPIPAARLFTHLLLAAAVCCCCWSTNYYLIARWPEPSVLEMSLPFSLTANGSISN